MDRVDNERLEHVVELTHIAALWLVRLTTHLFMLRPAGEVAFLDQYPKTITTAKVPINYVSNEGERTCTNPARADPGTCRCA